jgi:hypothetical protein
LFDHGLALCSSGSNIRQQASTESVPMLTSLHLAGSNLVSLTADRCAARVVHVPKVIMPADAAAIPLSHLQYEQRNMMFPHRKYVRREGSS